MPVIYLLSVWFIWGRVKFVESCGRPIYRQGRYLFAIFELSALADFIFYLADVSCDKDFYFDSTEEAIPYR